MSAWYGIGTLGTRGESLTVMMNEAMRFHIRDSRYISCDSRKQDFFLFHFISLISVLECKVRLFLFCRGYFINIEVGSAAFKLPRPYVCDHETDPPGKYWNFRVVMESFHTFSCKFTHLGCRPAHVFGSKDYHQLI